MSAQIKNIIVVKPGLDSNDDENDEYRDTLTMYNKMIDFINTMNWWFGHDIYSNNFKIGPFAIFIDSIVIMEIISTIYEMVNHIGNRDYAQALQAVSTVAFPIQARK